MKKILCFLSALIFTLFAFSVSKYNNKLNTSSAYNNTYNYNGDLLTDFNSMGNYSITDFRSMSFNGQLIFKISVYSNHQYAQTLLSFKKSTSSSVDYISTYNAFTFSVVDSNNMTLNVGIVSSSKIMHSPNGYYVNIAINSNTSCDIYFSYCNISFDSNLNPIFTNSYNVAYQGYNATPFSYLIDMNSDTDFGIFSDDSFFADSDDYLFYLLGYLSLGQNVVTTTTYINSSTSNLLAYKKGESAVNLYSNIQFYSVQLSAILLFVIPDTVSNNNHGVNAFMNLSHFHVSVRQPVSRINNTLVLYVFDYPQLFSNINSLSYSLSRDNNLYVINYNGALSNSYYNYIFNADIQNTLFDEYIDVDLSFGGQSYYKLNYDSNKLFLNFGFDFNFTYYTQPLVSTNGVYNYTFSKPSYVDMPFSLAPFYIPVLEIVENALIFLIFYCPIISDILNLLHMSEFLGSLITVINYYTTGVLGSFLTALISFFIFYALFKSIMPSVISSGVSVYNDSQFAYNREEYKKFLGKDKLSKRKNNYKKYETKRIDKDFNKLVVKSDKAFKRSQKHIDKRRKYWKKRGKDL